MIADRIVIENNEIIFRLDIETAGSNAAEIAIRARDEAQGYADQAETSRDEALQARDEAVQKANEAIGAKDDVEIIGNQVSEDRIAVSGDRSAVDLARQDVEEKAGIAEQAAVKAEEEADRAQAYADSLGVDNLTSKAELEEKALDLFRNEDIELFPDANLPVRRWTSSGITDYANGYRQTATPQGLLVNVPSSGTVANKHYFRTGRFIAGRELYTKIKIENNYLLLGGAGAGVGYIDENGDYVCYIYSGSGSIRKTTNYSTPVLQSNLPVPVGGDLIEIYIRSNIMSFHLNGTKITDVLLEENEFETELLIGQQAFFPFTFSMSFLSDPIRDYVKNELVNLSTLPKCFYSYDPLGQPSGDGSGNYGLFTIYVNVGGNMYCGFYLAHTVDMRPVVWKDLWRITNADFYNYNGSQMVPTGKIAMIGGESEFVFRRDSLVDDATGGTHGDEIYQEVTFYNNGVQIDNGVLTDSIGLTPCNDFYYLQKSTMHRTAEGGVIFEDHPIDCYHIKRTEFRDTGYKTFNQVTWERPGLVTRSTCGIACIAKDVTKFVYTDDGYNIIEMVGENGNYHESTTRSVDRTYQISIFVFMKL